LHYNSLDISFFKPFPHSTTLLAKILIIFLLDRTDLLTDLAINAGKGNGRSYFWLLALGSHLRHMQAR